MTFPNKRVGQIEERPNRLRTRIEGSPFAQILREVLEPLRDDPLLDQLVLKLLEDLIFMGQIDAERNQQSPAADQDRLLDLIDRFFRLLMEERRRGLLDRLTPHPQLMLDHVDHRSGALSRAEIIEREILIVVVILIILRRLLRRRELDESLQARADRFAAEALDELVELLCALTVLAISFNDLDHRRGDILRRNFQLG